MARLSVPGLSRDDADRINAIVKANFVNTSVEVAPEESDAVAGACEAACDLAAQLGNQQCEKLPGFLQGACKLAVSIAQKECKKLC